MTGSFKGRLFKLHFSRLFFALAEAFLKASGLAAFSLAVLSVVDAALPLDYATRLIALAAAVAAAAVKFTVELAGLSKKPLLKTCALLGGKILSAWSLFSSKEKFASLGISRELMDEEIEEGNRALAEARLADILFFDRKIFLFRSEEHTSELQSHSFIPYAGFCLKKKNKNR